MKNLAELVPGMSTSIGKMKVAKGKTEDGMTVYQWDVNVTCLHQHCQAIRHCHYEENIEEHGECQVLRRYMMACAKVLYEDQKDLSSAQRFQIGMHAMPLYRILCRMKIEEVGVERISYMDDKGMRRIEPLYKEIRETIKSIDQVWKSIGNYTKVPSVPAPTFGTSGNYYDAMEANALMGNSKVSPMRRKKNS